MGPDVINFILWSKDPTKHIIFDPTKIKENIEYFDSLIHKKLSLRKFIFGSKFEDFNDSSKCISPKNMMEFISNHYSTDKKLNVLLKDFQNENGILSSFYVDRFSRLYYYIKKKYESSSVMTISDTERMIIEECLKWLNKYNTWENFIDFARTLASSKDLKIKKIYSTLYQSIIKKPTGPKINSLREKIGKENIIKILSEKIQNSKI